MNLGRNNHSESVEVHHDDLTAQMLKWARDRTEAFEGGSIAGAPESSHEEQAKVNLGRNNDSESVEADQEDLTTQVLKWARDRTEALEGGSTASAAESPQEQEAKVDLETEAKANLRMGIVVVTLHEGRGDWGEAHLFSDVDAAGPFVESLMEDGVQEQRIVVFNCTQLAMNVSYRPVVRLQGHVAPEQVASQTESSNSPG